MLDSPHLFGHVVTHVAFAMAAEHELHQRQLLARSDDCAVRHLRRRPAPPTHTGPVGAAPRASSTTIRTTTGSLLPLALLPAAAAAIVSGFFEGPHGVGAVGLGLLHEALPEGAHGGRGAHLRTIQRLDVRGDVVLCSLRVGVVGGEQPKR